MPRRNSTVKIVDGKVVFSEEIIDYFENLRNEENSEWIDKYFEVLNNEENINAEKYSVHHIIPCFTFKDENIKNRKDTEHIADSIEGNKIKLSHYNHIFAHFYLWKIYNNQDSNHSFRQMCGKKYTNDLTEDELKNIATLIEECAKENKTEEEIKEHSREYYIKNKDSILEKRKQKYNENRDEILEQRKIYNQENKEMISERKKKKYKENRDEILENKKKYYKENRDRILEQKKAYSQENKESISKRRKKHYEENKEEIIEKVKEHYKNNREEILAKNKKRESQLCFDPKEEDICLYSTLRGRKQRHKEKYKDIILKDCIIQPQPQS
jgi:hypothetical protein